MSPQELAALVTELATATGERREELLAQLQAAGVNVTVNPKPKPPSTFVPRGCVKGADGIIRTAPGVFEARYRQVARRHVQHRQVRIHMPTRRESRPASRSHTRAHAAHGPPREPSDDDPPDLALRAIPVAEFRRVLTEAGL